MRRTDFFDLGSPVTTSYETTTLDAQVHDLDEKTHMVIYEFPIAIDTYQTEFGPGCFQAGFDRQLPVMCANHNTDAVIGRAVRAESLPNAHRLVGKFARFDDVPAARAAWSCVKDGIYPGASFHFVQGEAVPHPTVRSALQYRRARMIEFGPCLAPSLPGKHLVGIRSALGTRGSDVASELRALFVRIDLDRASDHSQELLRRGLAQTGRLPAGLRSACYDAVTRSEETWTRDLLALGEALDRAQSNRRGGL
jgi:hypothetical protein